MQGEAQTHGRAVLGVGTVPSPKALADSSSLPAVVSAPAALQVPCSPTASVEPPSHEVSVC